MPSRPRRRPLNIPGIDIAHAAVGVYGKPVSRERILDEGDRVEIYRALAADPKAARRARVKQARRGRRER